jgi:hypothetical protein
LSLALQSLNIHAMLRVFAEVVLLALAFMVGSNADAQTRRERPSREVDRAPPAPSVPVDKRDSTVLMPGPFNGKPYWLALAQCGGTYFKLNTFYAESAAQARVIKPDPKATAEYTRDLKDAIRIATIYFDATERFLMTDRGIERTDAVITYDPQSRAAGDRLKTVEAAKAAAQACPVLYQACHGAYPKSCNERLPPTG